MLTLKNKKTAGIEHQTFLLSSATLAALHYCSSLLLILLNLLIRYHQYSVLICHVFCRPKVKQLMSAVFSMSKYVTKQKAEEEVRKLNGSIETQPGAYPSTLLSFP